MRAPSCTSPSEDASVDQIEYVAVRRVLRALCEFGPLGRREVAFESLQHSVEHRSLSFVYTDQRPILPESCFTEGLVERFLGFQYGATEAAQEPGHPFSHV